MISISIKMGIPQYVRHIIQKYSDTHFWKPDLEVDHLLIDFNSVIYQVIILLNKELGAKLHEISPIVYENKLTEAVIRQLQHVICEVIRPKITVYIAVDGPPPRAKMVQQRARRYKTLKEQSFIKDLEKKYHITIPQLQWNKSAISPGTSFMVKLSKLIIKNMKSFMLHNSNLVIIFSDDSIPGEGEHKLMPSIRRLKNNETSVIYSPDADLIVLSIISGIPNIFILREPKDSDIEVEMYKNHEFMYLSIDACRKNFSAEFSTSNYKEILRDYSFLTFLCGNDFVSAIPFLKIKEGGIQLLIDAHKEIFVKLGSNQYLINSSGEINTPFLVQLLHELSIIEEERLKKWQRKRDKVRRREIPILDSTKEPWELELTRFNHEEYYSPLHPHFEYFNKVFDKIDYYSPEWISQYNKHFFPNIEIDEVCKEYIKSLHFCVKYYFEQVPSQTWYYRYRAAPTVKDLYQYLLGRVSSGYEWDTERPYTQFEQLMMILPRQSFKLLPRVLNIDADLDEYYPKTFILDLVQGTKFIYSEAILPEIPIEKIRAKIESVKLQFTDLEKERNTVRSRPYVYKLH